ncbi:MAG: ABC transporter permease [Clostridiales bacterium]|nr:ABC transporter permease [Clostridiales bacterium]
MKRTAKPQLPALAERLIYSLAAVVLSLLLATIVMLIAGYDPLKAFGAMLNGAFGSANAVANTLSKSIPLMFTGFAFAVASKGGVFNIGGEGQLYLAALASAVTALALDGLPRAVVLTASILAGMAAGGAVGALIGAIKAKLRINEVIVAIMVNYIVSLFASYMVNGPLKAANSMTAQSEAISSTYLFATVIPRSQLTTALYLGIAFAVLIFFLFRSTRLGFNIRAVGENAKAAASAGISIAATTIGVMALSGMLAGLAGVTEVLGKYGRFIDGFSPGFGFTGIAVAVLGSNNPFGILLTSLLFGALEAGSMKMSYVANVSTNMVMVIQGLVILFVATPEIVSQFVRRKGGKRNG